jgi:uncharacterized membrane protein
LSETALTREDAPPLDRLADLRRRMRLRAAEVAAAARVVYAGMAAYGALFLFASILHYEVFQTAHGDLGNMVQAIWSTRHGHFLQFTTLSGHERDRLGFHVDPFLLALVPLFLVWSNPLLLPIVQVLAVVSGALPVFWLARKHLGSPRAGAHFAFVYLLYPATQYSAFTSADSFHSVVMAVPLILYAVWFADEDRPVAFTAVALLAFTTKEEIPLAVGCLGIWYAVKKGRRLLGFGMFAAGFAVTAFDFLWVIPHFSHSGADPYTFRYRAVGGTPRGMAQKLVTDPMAFLHAVASGHKAAYLALLLVPLLGLCLLEPLLLLGAVPDLVINLLSSGGAMTSVGYQYAAGIVPFVIAASIFGAARFKRHADGLSMCVLVLTAAVALLSPIYVVGRDVSALGSPSFSAEAHALSLIPSGVPVSASNQLGGHLAERRYIYTFPKVQRARWIIVDINDPTLHHLGTSQPRFKRYIRQYESDSRWRVVFASHGVAVLHKRPTPKP